MERTLVLLKPDAMQRRLAGRLLARFEDKGLHIVGMKLLRVTRELAALHYAEHVKKPFYPQLEQFITSGPIVALAVEGLRAVSVVRAMMGPTNGAEAPPGTIRGDFGCSRQMNLIHGSDSLEAAQREIAIYFQPGELHGPNSVLAPWLSAPDEK
jgi:nucleoside-diphosphate kinase